MATVNIVDCGGVPYRDDFDNGPAFAAAVQAAGNKGTVVVPNGSWHLYSFPDVHAVPGLTIDHLGAQIEVHVAHDANGMIDPAVLAKINYWAHYLGVPVGITPIE